MYELPEEEEEEGGLEVYRMTNIGPQDSIHRRTKAMDPCYNMHNNFIYIEWKQAL